MAQEPSTQAQLETMQQAEAIDVRLESLLADAEYQQAIKLADQWPQKVGSAAGRSHPLFIRLTSKLANAHRYAGNTSEAAKLFALAKDMKSLVSELNRNDIFEFQNAAAAFFLESEEYELAIKQYKDVIALQKQIPGQTDQQISETLNELGRSYHSHQDYENARSTYHEAIRLAEKAGDEGIEDAAISQGNLALLHSESGNSEKAIETYKQSLATYKKTDIEYFGIYANTLKNFGLEYYEKENYKLAEPLFSEAVTVSRQHNADDTLSLSDHLKNLAGVYRDTAQYALATELFGETSEIVKELHGSESIEFADTIVDLASVEYTRGSYDAAEQLYRQSLAIAEAELGSEHEDVIFYLSAVADTLYQKKELKESKALLQQVVARLKETDRSDEYETALTDLGYAHKDLNEFDDAIKLFGQVRDLRKKRLGPKHADYATSLIDLGNVYLESTNYGKAESLYQKAVELFDSEIPHDNPNYSQSHHSLGSVFLAAGKYAESEAMLRKALKIRESSVGTNDIAYAETLYELGRLYLYWGEQPLRAEPIQKQALQIAADPKYRDSYALYGEVAEELGVFYQLMGDFEQAEEHIKLAMQAKKKYYGADSCWYARVAGNLGALYMANEKVAQAEPLLKEALEICQSIYGNVNLDTINAIGNLAQLHWHQGDLKSSTELLKLAVESQQEISQDNSYAMWLSQLGWRYYEIGDFVKSEPLLSDSHRIFEESYSQDKWSRSGTSSALAYLKLKQGKLKEGIQYLDNSRKLMNEFVANVLPTFTQEKQIKFLKQNFDEEFHYALALAQQVKDPTIVARSAEWLFNGKGVSHTALARKQLMNRDALAPESQEITKKLESIQNQISALEMTDTKPGTLQKKLANINELRKQEAELANQLAAQTRDKYTWVEVKDLRKQIPANAIYIDIAQFKTFDFSKAGKIENLPPRYAAWLVPPTGKGHLEIVDLGTAKEIDQLVGLVTGEIGKASRPRGALSSESEPDAVRILQEPFKELTKKLWQPLAERFPDGTTKLIISPDSALWLLPWAALPIREDRLLIEDYSFYFEISGREMVRTGNTSSSGVSAIFADPDYDLEPTAVKNLIEKLFPDFDFAKNQLFRSLASSLLPSAGRLPNTKLEANAVAPNMEKVTGVAPKRFTDRMALETVVKNIRNPQLLMLSTHGFFFQDQSVRQQSNQMSRLQNSSTAVVSKSGERLENPLLRCGLLFAGCNSKQPVGGDDGVFTGLEVVGLDLRGTEMVVLSACDTAVGKVNNGQGVAGLRQAFQLAGAQSVVATLWQVPDRDSAIIMNEFFKNLAAGNSRPEALRMAQLQRIQARRDRFGAAHPFYWGAWTITGK